MHRPDCSLRRANSNALHFAAAHERQDSLFTTELKSGQGCECIATVRFVLDVCGVSDKEDSDESTCPGDGVLDDLRQRIRGVVQGGGDKQEARGSCNDELHEEV